MIPTYWRVQQEPSRGTLSNLTSEEKLRELGLLIFEMSQEDLLVLYNYLIRGVREDGQRFWKCSERGVDTSN